MSVFLYKKIFLPLSDLSSLRGVLDFLIKSPVYEPQTLVEIFFSKFLLRVKKLKNFCDQNNYQKESFSGNKSHENPSNSFFLKLRQSKNPRIAISLSKIGLQIIS